MFYYEYKNKNESVTTMESIEGRQGMDDEEMVMVMRRLLLRYKLISKC